MVTAPPRPANRRIEMIMIECHAQRQSDFESNEEKRQLHDAGLSCPGNRSFGVKIFRPMVGLFIHRI